MNTLRIRSNAELLSTTLLTALLCLGFALAGPRPALAEEPGDAAEETAVEEAEDTKPEMLPNPMYESWSKFGIGSTVTMEMKTEVAGSVMESRTQQTLRTKTDEAVEVETILITVVNGEEVASVPQKQRHVAMLPRSPLTDTSLQNITEEGTETVTIDGREFETTWQTIRNENESGVSTMTSWHSDEIPGGLAKHHTVAEGVANATSTLTVLSFEAK